MVGLLRGLPPEHPAGHQADPHRGRGHHRGAHGNGVCLDRSSCADPGDLAAAERLGEVFRAALDHHIGLFAEPP